MLGRCRGATRAGGRGRHRPGNRARGPGPGAPDQASRVTASGAAGGAVAEVLAGVGLGHEVGEDEIVTLFSARGPEVRAVAEVADELRRDEVGDVVTWVANRNINYTNVCTFKCRFCAFSKGPLSLNLRGAPYLLELSDITERVRRGRERGRHRGVPPGRDPPELRRRLLPRGDPSRARSLGSDPHPRVHRPGGDRRGATPRRATGRLPAPPQRRRAWPRCPGTAAEILDDEVRAVLCPDKINTEQWLEAHRAAHSIGLRSNVTIMFGSIERPRSWARHLVRTRALQRETGGFTEFVPLPFVHMASPDLPAAQGPSGPDVPRDAAHARRGPHRLPGLDPQHPGQLGQDGRRRAPSRRCRPG